MGLRLHSIRTRLQAIFVLLALAAIGITGTVAMFTASDALQQATFDRLNASRATRENALERYFGDLRQHGLALSNSESTLDALTSLERAWTQLPPSDGRLDEQLLKLYQNMFAQQSDRPTETAEKWFPQDPRTRTLQSSFIAASPHPHGSRDLLLEAPAAGDYSRIHARYHPMFHRYLSAFGFYDLLLISAPEGRVLYTVMKEIDLGVSLTTAPYQSTALARTYQRALLKKAGDTTEAVIEDYSPYVASGFAPGAFIAAPIRRAGAIVGVLVMQISIHEVDRLMTGDRRWDEEGMGGTGEAYIVGPDNLLRSDLRLQIEDPEAFYRRLSAAGADSNLIQRLRLTGTSILTLPMDLKPMKPSQPWQGSGIARSVLDTPVLRSLGTLDIPDLRWVLVAEMDVEEALAPVKRLRTQIWTIGLVIAVTFFLIAGWLGASVAQPILRLAETARRLGKGDLTPPLRVASDDEIGDLEASFSRMVQDLQRTMVSKKELEVLAGRLIAAQEEERAKVARELHDDLVQRLAALAIEAGRAGKLSGSDPAGASSALERLKRQIAAISEDVHGLSRRLHPAMLEELGLEAALESECRAFLERGGPPVELRVSGPVEDLPGDVRLAIYRIAQEGLRNVQRHALAADIWLRVNVTSNSVELELRDDGCGFDRSLPGWRMGLGLASMEERARLLGGSFTVESKLGIGTRLIANLPFGDEDE